MSLKMQDLTREQVDKLIIEYGTKPAFIGQNPYIASSALHEILVCQMPGGLYNLELLDKKETEKSLQQTIKAFREYSNPKSSNP
jgi:hypothetical protein